MTQIDLEELVAHWAGINIDNDDDYEQKLDDWLIENYELDFNAFTRLMGLIFKDLQYNISPLTNKPFIGIATDTQWLVKKELDQSNFIANVIQWMSRGKELENNKIAHHQVITVNEDPKFDLYLVESGFNASFKKK